MTEGYAPFPERELQLLAGFHEDVAEKLSGYLRGIHLDRAQVCREAVTSHAALRERCLIAEMENTQLKRGVDHAA